MSDQPPCKKVRTEATSQMAGDDTNHNDDDKMHVAIPVAQQNPSDIFKLDVDCCEEIFEYLSIKDLHSFGQTCKRMQRIAGMYFQHSYPNAEIEIQDYKIYHGFNRLDGFNEFIENITISWPDMNLAEQACIREKCRSLKKMKFEAFYTDFLGQIGSIRESLTEVETLEIDNMHLNENSLDLFPNLKRIFTWVDKSRNLDWFNNLNKCPNLQDFSFTEHAEQTQVLEGFFDQIPHVQNIELCCRSLLSNKNIFLVANVKLENFIINFLEDDGDKVPVCALLNELYGRDFYKRLHWSQLYDSVDQQTINLMALLRGLNTISFVDMEPGIIWPMMNDLEQMYIYAHIDFDLSSLPNLERVHIHFNTMETLLIYIRGLKKLKEIYNQNLYQGTYFNENIIDVYAINKERAKLPGSSKLTIYVPEEVFLATKYRHGVNHSFFEIKRNESKKSSAWNFWTHY